MKHSVTLEASSGAPETTGSTSSTGRFKNLKPSDRVFEMRMAAEQFPIHSKHEWKVQSFYTPPPPAQHRMQFLKSLANSVCVMVGLLEVGWRSFGKIMSWVKSASRRHVNTMGHPPSLILSQGRRARAECLAELGVARPELGRDAQPGSEPHLVNGEVSHLLILVILVTYVTPGVVGTSDARMFLLGKLERASLRPFTFYSERLRGRLRRFEYRQHGRRSDFAGSTHFEFHSFSY